jgi:hypothetical protein
MSVALPARVLVACLLAAPAGILAEEFGPEAGSNEPTATPTAASTSASTSAATPTPTAYPTPSRGPGATSTTTAGATATATNAKAATSAPKGQRPPPAVLFVPLLGTVVLPLTVPTAVPHVRAAPPQGQTKETAP